MKPVELENPDVVLRGPADMPECCDLTAIMVSENGYPGFVSLWKPSQSELAALMKGGTVAIHIVGMSHPPVALGVMDISGNPVDD